MSAPVWENLICINTASQESIGLEIGAITGGAAPASAAWPGANDALFVPMYLAQPTLIKRLFVVNGGTASGNLDMGIYTPDGARVISKGSTAQSGTSALQFLDITDTMLGPGAYYLALAMDGTTGTTFRFNLSTIRCQQLGIARVASAFALPASVTLATVAAGYIPMIGAEIQTVF